MKYSDFFKYLVLIFFFSLPVTVYGQVVINEIRIDQPSTDNDEYFELSGPSGASLDGLTYLVIGDGTGGSGVIEAVVDLGGLTIPDCGFFVAAEDTFSLGTADLTANLNFENSDNVTHLLVEDFTGSNGDDLDTNDDGTLDITPWASIVDEVALIETVGSGELVYSAVQVGPDGTFVPGHVFRSVDGSGVFNIGAFDPSGGDDTPGQSLDGTVICFEVIEPTELTIMEIQGAGHTSPFEGELVETSGIVTAVDTSGFYLQDPSGDADISTSDGIFVFTGGAPTVSVQDQIEIEGTVSEFFPGGVATRNLSTTQLSNATIISVNPGQPLPVPVIIGIGGRVPPTENIDDDAFGAFEPVIDGIDFFESMEAMLVTVQQPMVVGGTNRFGEIFTVTDDGAAATGISLRNTLNISPDDFNPEKVQIDEDTGILPGFNLPEVNAGDMLDNVTGVVGYGFGNFEVYPTQPFGFTHGNLIPETTEIAGDEEKLTVATYNVLNLDLNDADGDTDVANGRFDAIAQQIVNNLNAPDVIGLQEVQDNTGSDDDGTVAADATLQMLVDTIVTAGGPTYEFIDNTFIGNNTSGGQPGGNIRTAFLFNPARVGLVPGSVQTAPDLTPFAGSRLPIIATFDFNGEEVTVVNNHFSSKGGSAPILGVEQPFEARQEEVAVNGSLDERQAQAQGVRDFVDTILTADNDANVVVLGDLNEFEFISPVSTILPGGDAALLLTNLVDTLPDDEIYSFIFQGNSQALDHILISNNLLGTSPQFDQVHTNSEFAETDQRASDHDPAIVCFDFDSEGECPTFDELRYQINELINDGELRNNRGQRLIKLLDRAERALNNGNIDRAEDRLEKFIEVVERYINRNRIDEEEGVELIKGAECILDSLDDDDDDDDED